MNREIKFRAWDGEKIINDVSPWRWDFVIENSWHRCIKNTGNEILGSGGDSAEMLVPAKRFKELMQFTGLKDKNGVDIYEGDILIYEREFKYLVDMKHPEFIVGVDDLSRDNQPYYDVLWEKTSRFEVIGSLNQNPELLK